MTKPIFTGVCTALVTPFLEGKINYPMLEQLLKYQLEAQIPAVVIAGTTGESPTLTDSEKIELFRRAKSYVGNRCTIIAGTGSNSTAHAVALSIQAEQAGADALLVVSPYYNKSTEEGLFSHYLSIAHAVSIPIILYNVPSRTGLDMPVTVYKRLSRVPNIIGVKEASTDIGKILEIRSTCPETFSVFTGNDNLTVPAMALGAQGVISVASNVCPKEMAIMADAAVSGDYGTARDIACELAPLFKLLSCEVNPIPIKQAMKEMGFDCGKCRLPLSELTAEHKNQISKYFQR